jgi:hypothetical protein
MTPRIFNEETRNIGARVEFRSCISTTIFALMRSSNTLATIVQGILKAVPFITKEFQDDWTTIDAVSVDFPWGESENGYRLGTQTFGPWSKRLDPDKFPQGEVFPNIVSKDDIEMRVIVSVSVDDDLYIDGALADDPGYASYVYKEYENWDESRTITLDVENNYAEATPGFKHPHGASGSITVQTRLKPGSCSYYNRVRIRDFQYGMQDKTITYKGLDTIRGTLTANCNRFELTPCQGSAPEQSRNIKGRDVTFPPPKGNKTPPCRKYVSMSNFGFPPAPSIHKISDGPLGRFQTDSFRRTYCDSEIRFAYMLGVDVIPNGLEKNTCSALFLASNTLELFTFLDSPIDDSRLGLWEDVSIPGGNSNPKLDDLINAPLRQYFTVDVNLSSRYYDRIDTKRNKCVCNDLETSPCLDPATKRAIERLLFAGQCVAAGALATAAISLIGATPPGLACLAAGAALIMLTANPHNTGGGQPPYRNP